MTRRHWTYVRLLVPTTKALDIACNRLADDEPFDRLRAEHPWFYLRFVGVLGPQIRLRMLCGEDGRDAVERQAFLAWASRWYGELTDVVRDMPAAAQGPFPGRIGFDVASYRPEVNKYGSAEVVGGVEDLWARQCDALMGLWGDATQQTARTLCWTVVARAVTRELFGTDAMSERSTHASYWARAVRPTPQASARFNSGLAKLVLHVDEGGAEVPPTIETMTTDLVDSIRAFAECERAADRSSLSFNLLHILANRLGLSPLEEGLAMGLLATDRRLAAAA